ncbi:ABC transporter, ATP-binding protein [Clostridium pasteurianum DSM 525 = ATCC 6013]|uniref:ABC transporter, ATP-binding protein n=1 Tax=Clostridium pasteurianum DSM 525 = ATCC 6013 TaxID=1262449 RepID=A0A0H3J8U1_CLOPA|nr:ABC transporter ATP-binding protein [Clostridium pasteurianum]AJA49909.1 ABC transporter, ATP-binding protein [Clostridium pasteurianum DSM 525 = ATCC 6013]AJA53897.1 ABC transporter, ATP-binding protein [Clostridium pasteurianum DSM 525 = ATCC 6013]AOZ77047.1 antibiotic ABC transporter ATP-binding protein [Clostridium pasteurianum DSM 525 = ATCC 6013]AOZ80844.1 antibiotic ABC transporter ATP-binding protein [Clostridium pasteurianum]ELP57867.1 multidrug ABC transporter ATPase [Clostridium 
MSNIKVKNVTKRFNDKLVLNNIDFEIKKGDIFGLIGPNGAGKSTLINIITGLLKPSSGDIEIGGHSVLKEAVKAKEYIGLVPQELAIMETMSAYDNLEYFGAFYGLGGKLLKERIAEALEVTGLRERKKEKVKKFSGGMKRRLNLAIAIMHRPKILIMDEPTVGVDPQSRNCIFEFIKKVNRKNNTTVIYTSHYMEEVESLCNDIFILDLGKEIASGSKQEIKSMANIHGTVRFKVKDYNEEFIFMIKKLQGVKDGFIVDDTINLLIDENNFVLEDLLKLAADNDKKIISFNLEEASLEEVFLSLTGKKLRD